MRLPFLHTITICGMLGLTAAQAGEVLFAPSVSECGGYAEGHWRGDSLFPGGESESYRLSGKTKLRGIDNIYLYEAEGTGEGVPYSAGRVMVGRINDFDTGRDTLILVLRGELHRFQICP